MHTDDTDNTEVARAPQGDARITVYWRPGCPFCWTLLSRLRHSGLPFDEVNIWEDPDAAAFVRSVAHGNETVPTVSVGGTSLVNPSMRHLVRAVAAEAPHLVPARSNRNDRETPAHT